MISILALRLHQLPSAVRAEDPRDLATVLDLLTAGE